MALTFTGAGGLFTRLGKYGRVINAINRFRGDATVTLADSAVITDIGTELARIADVYSSPSTALRQAIDGLQTKGAAAADSLNSLADSVRSAARKALIEQVYADVALASRTDHTPAIEEVIRQMITGAYYVTASAIAGTTTAGSGNAGNGACRVSLVDGLGRATANVLAETLLATCLTGNTAGSERFEWKGAAAVGSPMSHLWPGGSGAVKQISAVAPDGANSFVTNGDFEDFAVANTPDGWVVVTGTLGTTVKSNAAAQYAGAKCLEIVGNGSQLTELTFDLSTAGLESLTPYSLNFFCKNSSNPSTGQLTVSLYDGSGTITNEAGTNNSFVIDLTTLGTSYVSKGGFFQLPEPLPATIKLRVMVTTAIENAKSLYIDHMAMVEATELYTGGPWLGMFSGSTAWSLLDTWKLVVTNDRTGNWQELWNRLFDMRIKGLLLPTSGSNAINDNLID